MTKQEALKVAEICNTEFRNSRELRRAFQAVGLLPKSCREEAPYYYSRNGSGKAVRSPGLIAALLSQSCRVLGMPEDLCGRMYQASWCARWRRTLASLQTEHEGSVVFWNRVQWLSNYVTARKDFGRRAATTYAKIATAQLQGAEIIVNANARYTGKRRGFKSVDRIAQTNSRMNGWPTSVIWACYR